MIEKKLWPSWLPNWALNIESDKVAFNYDGDFSFIWFGENGRSIDFCESGDVFAFGRDMFFNKRRSACVDLTIEDREFIELFAKDGWQAFNDKSFVDKYNS